MVSVILLSSLRFLGYTYVASGRVVQPIKSRPVRPWHQVPVGIHGQLDRGTAEPVSNICQIHAVRDQQARVGVPPVCGFWCTISSTSCTILLDSRASSGTRPGAWSGPTGCPPPYQQRAAIRAAMWGVEARHGRFLCISREFSMLGKSSPPLPALSARCSRQFALAPRHGLAILIGFKVGPTVAGCTLGSQIDRRTLSRRRTAEDMGGYGHGQ